MDMLTADKDWWI